ncbi:MAG: ABC transporter substrate-binding protein, partial [Thaumarchaeota archaeon]|nr:ABC transporter substrate-binding protein [Nitrososphaerota archaeon]
TWLGSYGPVNMTAVNFGPDNIALLNQSGLINPTQPALSMMKNTSWPIYVTGPNQIVFNMYAPFLWFPGLLAGFEGEIFDVQYLLHHGGFGTPTTFNSFFNLNPLPGTGPYMVTQVSANSFVQFVQDPNYWAKNWTTAQVAQNPFFDKGHVKNVIINTKLDDLARYTDLSTGAAQLSVVESADWNLVTANPAKYSYFTLPQHFALQMLISLNTHLYPTNITAVRQAIVHAINYPDIIAKAFLGNATEGVAPEYPAFQQFYNLANLPPYSYNLTLAKQYLAKANITSFPTLTYYTSSSCLPCEVIGEIVQSDLAALNINVNILVVQSGTYYASQGTYATNLNNSAVNGHITINGGAAWAPSALTPVDAWADFVSNTSFLGNTAVYYNPTVQNSLNAFFTSSNITYIQSQIKLAQVQIYNDAPYVPLELGLLYGSGSIVWQKGVVHSFLLDPLSGGVDIMPLFNTVTFG